MGRKLREHGRKLRETSKNRKHKSRKDPGIPRSLPCRENIVSQLKAEHEKERNQKRQRKGLKFLEAPSQPSKENIECESHCINSQYNFTDPSRAFHKDFKQILELSDVIIKVLDARDPLGCRIPVIEEHVLNSGGKKRLILVLNKADLIPRKLLDEWLLYLRREHPTIAYKATSQNSTSRDDEKARNFSNNDDLLQLLKNYCRSDNVKTAIRVGVVGYPNVGKSSLINSMKRSKACQVSGKAGSTANLQQVHLDGKITLIDCPGIVFARPKTAEEEAKLFLRNCLNIEQLSDVMSPVELILKKSSNEFLMNIYGIPNFGNTEEFISLVAQRFGKLRKGGIPDLDGAAKKVLDDWIKGVISHFTIPPENIAERFDSLIIVKEFSKEFCLDSNTNTIETARAQVTAMELEV